MIDKYNNKNINDDYDYNIVLVREECFGGGAHAHAYLIYLNKIKAFKYSNYLTERSGGWMRAGKLITTSLDLVNYIF